MPSYYRDPDAPAPNAPRQVCVTALIARDGAFLVERRADSVAVEWAFVGGALEDESVIEALRREVREETGFEIETASLLGVFSDPSRTVAYPDGNVRCMTSIPFRVVPRGTGQPIPSRESAAMRFVVPLAELGGLRFGPAHRPIRDALLADLDGVVVA